jgi:hypothetical protein
VSTVTLLAEELLLKAGVAGACNVLAIAPSTDTGGSAALEALTTGVATAAGPTPSTVLALAAGGAGRGNVGSTRLNGCRSGSGETGGGRAVAVASGGGGGSSAVESRCGGSRLGGVVLTGAEVRGHVGGAASVKGNTSWRKESAT